ncbi:hypothetical protein [Gallalistipes aquisgranensis]|uniref:hypothetical protein n=1 Tax=Gallalistipes aquisgranensis TaxID=2779358 RepID=UPI001CF847D1|nr:hypothetical protein [Gallalistipes aquisgranensis]MBE5033415.1 hypothetical protein [Gallalistipes aquisgranensis]
MATETKPKKRLVVSYHNLPAELQEELKKKYPNGYTDSMLRIDKGPGDFFYAVVLETEDTSYLVKVDVKVDGQLDEEEDKEYYDDEIKGADEIIDDNAEESDDE